MVMSVQAIMRCVLDLNVHVGCMQASCRTPSQFEGFAAGLAKLSTSDDEYQRLACDLMWRLLRPGPHERMRSSAILKHEFFL